MVECLFHVVRVRREPPCMMAFVGFGCTDMSDVPSNNAERVLMVATALAVWFALLLQVPLTMRTSISNGMTVIGAILTYFSFFTLLTNLIVALVLTFSLLTPKSGWGRFFSSPVVATGTALYIATVGLVYSFLLRQLWNPEGLDKLADIILHDVVPVMYVAFWIFFVPKSGLSWRNPASWAIYPLVYLVRILIRGAISGRYPYPFVNVDQLGYPHVLRNSGVLLAIFLMIGFAVVAVAKWKLPKTVRAKDEG